MNNHSALDDAVRIHAKPRLKGSSKLQDHHFARAAIVYVRQSDPHQVRENTESTELQYGLVDRAVQLGWSADQVEVIDEARAQRNDGRGRSASAVARRSRSESYRDHPGHGDEPDRAVEQGLA